MNNNENFKKWMQDINESDTKDMNRIIDKTVRSSKKRRNHIILYPLSAFVSLFVIFAILLNVSDEFYVLAKSNSIIAPIAQLIRFNKSLETAFDADFYQTIDKSVSVGDMTLEVKYAVRDIYNLVLFVKQKENDRYLKDSDVFGFNIDLFDSEMRKIDASAVVSSFQDYIMIDISSLTPLEENDFTLRYFPSDYDSAKYGDIAIQLDPKNNVKILEETINKTMIMEGQKVILDKIEIGAFQSRLQYHIDPSNTKLLSEIRFEGEKQAFVFEGKIDGEDLILMSFTGGYVQNKHSMKVTMKDCSILNKEFETVTFDLSTMKFDRLPEFVDVVDARFKYGILYLSLNNQLKNEGTNIRLEPKLGNEVMRSMLSDEFSTSIFEFEIAKSTGLVQFKMTGGRKSCAVPVSIDIKY